MSGLAADREDERALLLGDCLALDAGSERKTSVPAGASRLSPSSVNVARPRITT